MAPECPGLVIWDELVAKGWVKVESKVVHVAPVSNTFDGRAGGVSRKFYFQSLLIVEKALERCSGTMPSNQPMLFYRLLIAGARVLPALGDKEYKRLWKLGDHGDDLLALEDQPRPEPPPPLPPPSGDVLVFSGAKAGEEPKPRPPPKPGPRPDGGKAFRTEPKPLAPAPGVHPPGLLGSSGSSGSGGGGGAVCPGSGGGAGGPAPPAVEPPPVVDVPPPLVFGGGGDGGHDADLSKTRRPKRAFLTLEDGTALFRDYYDPQVPGKEAFFYMVFEVQPAFLGRARVHAETRGPRELNQIVW